MRDRTPSQDARTAAIFLRLLGLVYACAIVSLWVQLEGLIGDEGILPVAGYLERAAARLGSARHLAVPTLAWLSPSDGFLHALSALGTALALALMAGWLPTVALAGLWVIYLSLTVAGQTFLHFQWDNLLLETGLLAIVLVPPRWRLGGPDPPAPSRLVVFLLRWLLFRLMLGSGLVKLASHDPAWWPDLTALTYHYETTPLPTWTGWWVHQAPLWVHQASCLAMLAAELVVPWGVFGPRPLRLAACGAFVALQAAIAATGNYTYFNLLTVALCVVLLDDRVWPRRRPAAAPRPVPWWWTAAVVAPLATVLLITSAALLERQLERALERFGWAPGLTVPPAVVGLQSALQPFRSVNGYGLFARMTKERPEIVIEGSVDGRAWRPYEFRWKPGAPARRPRFVQPHQPRLDWQMWFAALADVRRTPWFGRLLERLLAGAPPVLALLGEDPFPGAPPRWVRAVRYEYHFTDRATRARDGTWWRRVRTGLYAPAVTLAAPGAGAGRRGLQVAPVPLR